MLLASLLGGGAPCCGAVGQALLAGASCWGAAAGQQRLKHYVPAVTRGAGGAFDAEDTYQFWQGVWRAPPRRDAPQPRGPRLDPEERALLRQAGQAAGLPPAAARRVAAAVDAGALPLDPLALAQRIHALGEVAAPGGGGGAAAARLLGRAEGPALLSVPPPRLRRQAALLAKLLPEYSAEALLGAAPRWAVHGPARLAERLREVEGVFAAHLGAEFPRERLAAGGGRWRWLFTAPRRAKTINALELVMLAGPELAARMARACPRLLAAPAEPVAAALRALQSGLGVSSTREAAALVAPQPVCLMRGPLALAEAAESLVRLMGGDAAAARALVAAQPTLLLYSGGEWEDKLSDLARTVGLPGDRAAALALVAAAPNLLTRSLPALRASWGALRAAAGGGRDEARALLAPGSGAPRLLAYSAAELRARGGALDALEALGDGWRERVAAARGAPPVLAAVLSAPRAASARLRWLVHSQQRLAPGGMGLLDLVRMSDAAFADIYPQWTADADAAAGAAA
ncbi:MAG: hypothetical protein J3K34DRAFT_519075 [Monoraphidium minutum]|nr:MAG: hypothetical protein J3K34DRAFT_519075 [Monoraphidium minutum]